MIVVFLVVLEVFERAHTQTHHTNRSCSPALSPIWYRTYVLVALFVRKVVG